MVSYWLLMFSNIFIDSLRGYDPFQMLSDKNHINIDLPTHDTSHTNYTYGQSFLPANNPDVDSDGVSVYVNWCQSWAWN